MNQTYDVLVLADCHVARPAAVDIAEEITALHRAGYTVALVDTAPSDRRPFDDRIRAALRAERAELLSASANAPARLVIVHRPEVIAAAADPPEALRGELIVAVADDPTPDLAAGVRAGDLPGVAATLKTVLDAEIRWAPRGATARAALASAPGVHLLSWEWPRTLDTEVARIQRSPRDRLWIGRVAGAHERAWPPSADELLAAYPDDPDLRVRILGDVSVPLRVLRRPPLHWIVHPPGSLRRRDLLGRIHVYVDLSEHDAALSPGRSALEAIASGAVLIGPAAYREALGDAFIEAKPGDVREIAAKLAADRSAFDVRAARQIVRERFDHASFARRIASLIGDPSRAPAPSTSPPPRRATRRILFVSSNGAGVGHLMRLMAIARRAGDDVEPVFFTMSQAVQAVRQMGYPVEYLASHHYARLPGSLWHPHLRRRVSALIDLYKPSAVVFDGTAPYRGLVQAMREAPHIPFIWSRRAMWKPGLGQNALRQVGAFHLVVEPGDLADAGDVGETVALRGSAVRPPPVVYHDPDETLSQSDAKAELGLDLAKPAVLVQLGAGNINDISSALSVVVRRLAREENLQVCVASSIIGIRETPAFERVKLLSVYPLARYLRGFEFAVTAAGYNTYHEMVAAAVPTVFVPNLDTALDNQAARAAFAEQAGFGLSLGHVDDASFDRCVRTLLDPARREAMAARARELFGTNGAREAMRAIEQLIDAWEDGAEALRAGRAPTARARRRRVDVGGARDAPILPPMRKGPVRALLDRAFVRTTRRPRNAIKRRLRLARMVIAGIDTTAARSVRLPVTPGPEVDIVDAARQPVAMIQVWEPTPGALAEIVARVARLHRSRRSFRPLFVTDADDLGSLRRHGYLFEYVMPREAWARLDHPLSWDEYRWRRLAMLMGVYRPEHVISGSTWEQLEPSLLGAVLDPVGED